MASPTKRPQLKVIITKVIIKLKLLLATGCKAIIAAKLSSHPLGPFEPSSIFYSPVWTIIILSSKHLTGSCYLSQIHHSIGVLVDCLHFQNPLTSKVHLIWAVPLWLLQVGVAITLHLGTLLLLHGSSCWSSCSVISQLLKLAVATVLYKTK